MAPRSGCWRGRNKGWHPENPRHSTLFLQWKPNKQRRGRRALTISRYDAIAHPAQDIARMSEETPDREVATEQRAETLRLGPDCRQQQPAAGTGDTDGGGHDAPTLAVPPDSERTLPIG